MPTLPNQQSPYKTTNIYFSGCLVPNLMKPKDSVGWALAAHASPPKSSLKTHRQRMPTLPNQQFPYKTTDIYFSGCLVPQPYETQGVSRVGTCCTRVSPKRQPETAWATSAHPTTADAYRHSRTVTFASPSLCARVKKPTSAGVASAVILGSLSTSSAVTVNS